MHQKSVLLKAQALTIFGSSNWTSPSSSSQEEHNYFTHKADWFTWFSDQFERKWTNATGRLETEPFHPLPPDRPDNVAPLHGAIVPGTAVTLQWNAGIWAHLYDVYFGTEPDPPLLAANVPLGPSTSASNDRRYDITQLAAGHHVLLADRRQDDGAPGGGGTGVQLHHRGCTGRFWRSGHRAVRGARAGDPGGVDAGG